MANDKSAERLFQMAMLSAIQQWGSVGWQKLSAHMQRAYVTEHCFLLLSRQDESAKPETIRTLLDYFHSRIVDSFPTT